MYMHRLTSALRHRDETAREIKEKAGGSPPENPKTIYWVPNEGLNDSSRGNCKNSNAAVGRQGDTT